MTSQTHDPDGDNEADLEPPGRPTWRERLALQLLGAIMAAMFAGVISLQARG